MFVVPRHSACPNSARQVRPAISDHVYPHYPSDTLLEALLDDENLVFLSADYLWELMLLQWSPIQAPLDGSESIQRRVL